MAMMARRKKPWLWKMTALLVLLSGRRSRTGVVVVAFVPRSTFAPTTKWPTTRRTTTTTQSDRNDDNIVAVSQTKYHHEETIDNNNLNDNNNNNNDDNALLEYSIDSFLRGDYYSYYDRPNILEDDDEDYAVAPLPGLSPSATVKQALHVLRKTTTTTSNDSSCQAAACFLRFCVPLRRRERWSPPLPSTSSSSPRTKTNSNTSEMPNVAPWKELLRGSLTPTMFVRRLRASSDLSILLDWNKLDVKEGTMMITGKEDDTSALEDSCVTIVNAAMYVDGTGSDENKNRKTKRIDSTNIFSESTATTTPPELLQIQLNRVGGVWLIESIQRMPKNLFQNTVAPT